MKRKQQISFSDLRELVDYDAESGALTWKDRDLRWFVSERLWKTWNACYAGTPAFNTKNLSGYRTGRLMGINYYAHRIAWALVHGAWPPAEIDHINADKADNRLSNLRAASRTQNNRNRRARGAKPKGVSKAKPTAGGEDRWRVTAGLNGRKVCLGTYTNEEDAARAYDAFAGANYGEFACLNRPET